MAHLTFYWDTWAIIEDEDIFRIIQREDYEGVTWQECCEKCSKCLNWDDSDLVKGYEEKVIETDRQLKEISIHENGKEINAPQEIYEYYHTSVRKVEKTEVHSRKRIETKKLIN